MNHKVNCNDWKGMNNLMKNVTKWYVPKDSLIITFDQLKDLITNKLNPMKDPFDRITVVFISLMYYRYISQGQFHAKTTRNVKLDHNKIYTGKI